MTTRDGPPPTPKGSVMTRWDLRPIFDILEAFSIPSDLIVQPLAFTYDSNSSTPKSLGDFDRLYKFMGWKINTREPIEYVKKCSR